MNQPLPFTLAPQETKEIKITYIANAEPGASTEVHFRSDVLDVTKSALVVGRAIAPGAQIVANDTAIMSCVEPGQTRNFRFTISATGSAATSIKAVRPLVATPGYSAIVVRDAGNNVIDFSTGSKLLQRNEKWFVETTFDPPEGVNSTSTLTVQMIGDDDQVIQSGTVIANVVTEYRAIALSSAQVTIPQQNYGSNPVQSTFEITNTESLPVRLDQPIPPLGNTGSHPNAFRIVSPTFPVDIPAGEKITVTVEFDPRVAAADTQTVNYMFPGSMCTPPMASWIAGTTVGGFTAQGFATPAIFACATSTNDVVVTAGNSPTGTLDFVITGNDAARFTTTMNGTGIAMTAGQELRIPVTFTPAAQAANDTYDAQMELTYTNAQNRSYTQIVPMQGIAGGINVVAASDFIQTEAQTGDEVVLPINITTTKNLNNLDLTNSGIRSARVVYTYNEDLLTIQNNNLDNAVSNEPAGWTLNVPASSVGNGRIELVFDAAANSDISAINSLGEIRFQVRLADSAEKRETIAMQTFELRDAAGTPYTACAATAGTGGDIDFVKYCGDEVFQKIMNGATGFSVIEPVRPNPITDQKVVTLRYATRVSTPVTIEVIDALGNVVDQVVRNLEHGAGAYEVKYDVSNLESGSYIYRMRTLQNTLSSRFVIAR
jgi:hypothetical protein